MGEMAYYLTLPMFGILVSWGWRKGLHLEYPAFFSFLVFSMIRSAVLWPLHVMRNPEYAFAYEVTTVPLLFISAWLVGELFDERAIGAALGTNLVLFQIWNWGQHNAAMWFGTQRYAGYVITGLAILAVLLKRRSQVATGLVVYALFPAIIRQSEALHTVPWLPYVAPVSGLVAGVIWIHWLRSYSAPQNVYEKRTSERLQEITPSRQFREIRANLAPGSAR